MQTDDMARRILRLALRPSWWVALISIVAYWDSQALRGSFVYDDSGKLLYEKIAALLLCCIVGISYRYYTHSVMS
jgi:hypothetical protein